MGDIRSPGNIFKTVFSSGRKAGLSQFAKVCEQTELGLPHQGLMPSLKKRI